MTRHPEPEQLSAYLDHELAAAERARLEEHLGACASCQATRSALEASMRAVAALPPLSPTATEARALRAEVLDQLRSQHRAPSPVAGLAASFAAWRRRLSWRLYAAAAAVAVLLTGAISLAAFELSSASPMAASPAAAPSAANRSGSAAANGALRQPAGSTKAAGARPSLAFSSPDQAWAYVAGQASSLTPSAEKVNAADAAGATNGFLQSLAAQPGSSDTAAGIAPDFLGATGPAASTPVPAPSPLYAPALPAGSLAACVSAVQALVPTPSVPLEAVAVTYQGRPAWLLVYAFAPPASPQGPLTQEQVWLRSQPACLGIASDAITP